MVEIMVALLIGLVLLTGIVEIYIGSKQSYRLQDQAARMQEGARFALDSLNREARMAGFYGCSIYSEKDNNYSDCNNPPLMRPTRLLNVLNNRCDLAYDFRFKMQGFEANSTHPGQTYAITAVNPAPASSGTGWTPNLVSTNPKIDDKVIAGSDVLVIRAPIAASRSALSTSTATTLQVGAGDATIAVGDLLIAANCARARLFQATTAVTTIAAGSVPHGTSGTPGNACTTWGVLAVGSAPVASAYNEDCSSEKLSLFDGSNGGVEIIPVATILYYVGRRDPTTTDPSPGPSLYRKVGTDSAQELVEGVENMQVLYGVRLANNNLAYLPADSVINWTQVVSLRIGLLLRTLDDNLTTTADNQSYNANGADVLGTMVKPVSDRRLRRVISTTISIRNTAI